MQLIETIDRIPKKYFKHLTRTDGLFEIRVEAGSNIYSVYSFFDKGQLIIPANDCQKKTQKTQKNEIELAEKLKKNNTSMEKNKNKLTSFSDHLDQEYGTKGTEKRETYKQEFEAFKLGVMLQELRKENGMTQEQLAQKCGTTKTYISRIENNVSDIRLSTLMSIIQVGLGGHLNLNVSL